MEYLVYFILGFILVYLFYLITVVLQKKKYDEFRNSNQLLYFINKYKLNKKNINMKKFINEISLLNSLVIATSFTISCIFDSLILQLIVGFVAVITLIILVYSLYGKVLKRRDKNV